MWSWRKYGEFARPCPSAAGATYLPAVATLSGIIYYDFTSVEAFALSEIAASFAASVASVASVVPSVAGAAEFEWRGVEADPGLPVPMIALDRWEAARLEVDVGQMVRRVPSLNVIQPTGRPNTRHALHAVASVARAHAARAGEFRVRLFREYWNGRADISSRAVVQKMADEAGVPRWVDLEDVEAGASLERWELDWRTERLGGVPRAIRSDGQILWGVKDEASTREFLLGR